MAVITAMSGGHHPTRSAISPGPYVPISATNTSVPSARCSLIARARPALLLKLAGVATIVREGRTRWTMWPLVEVLP